PREGVAGRCSAGRPGLLVRLSFCEAAPVARTEGPSADRRRRCGPLPPRVRRGDPRWYAMLVTPAQPRRGDPSEVCDRCAARRFARIWTTWITESLVEVPRPRLSQATPSHA